MNNDANFDPEYFFSYCRQLYEKNEAFDQQQTQRQARHRHLHPDSAKLLASLILNSRARRVLEVGTSTGYSTLWIAFALRDTADAQLISLDIDAARSGIAQTHLQTLGLDDKVCLRVEDALTFLQQQSQPFEVIFLDAERSHYIDYLAYIHALLPVTGMLIVDNVLSHPDEVSDFLSKLQGDRRYLCSTIPIGAGLFIAVRQQP